MIQMFFRLAEFASIQRDAAMMCAMERLAVIVGKKDLALNQPCSIGICYDML